MVEYLVSLMAAAGVALMIMSVVGYVSGASWTTVMLVYVVMWTVFYDARVIRTGIGAELASRFVEKVNAK